MQTEQAKIYHHHTPREYLLPWADSDERIAWLGYGKVARSALTVVGGENDFYKLKELTTDDVAKIRWVIQQLPESGRAGHEDFLWSYLLPTRLRRRVEQCIARDPTRMSEQQIAEARNRINVVISNLNENYHASIERRFWPYLNAIRKRDLSFYKDARKAGEFFHGLSVQYLRTKTIKERIRRNVNTLFEDIERVWDVLSHVHAVVMGGSLLVDRHKFQILVLDNETQVPFITSDQPIINLLSDPHDFDPPTRMELYYPLSPTRAMLFLEKSTPTSGISTTVSVDEAHQYNRILLDHSGLRVFSNSDEYLMFLRKYTGTSASHGRHANLR